MSANLSLPPIRFARTTLGNGLDVITRRQPALPIAAVNLWYHVGSKDEERRQRGFAHLFEHLMFEGSEHYPGDFFKPLQRLGAGINGSTSTDRTNYFEDVPAAHLELVLAMESDRMGFLLPALDDHKLRVQKDVVKNEYRQNYANRPYGQVWRVLSEALYPPQHPYSWLTIGAMEDVEAASRDDVEAFFRRFYVPANASLAIVGDVDEGRALALADRYFGGLPGGSKALRPWTPPALPAEELSIGLRDRVELDRAYRIWHTVPQFGPDDAPLVLLGDILARGRSSRLYQRLVVESQAAQDVSAYQSGRELAGTFGVIATMRPGRSTAESLDAAGAEIVAIADSGPAPEELERVQNGRLAGFVYALDNVGGFGGVADRLNAYNVYLDDPGAIVSDLERFRGVTPDDVRRVAGRYLAGMPGVTLTVTGRGAAVATSPPVDRAARPSPTPAAAYRAPVPEVRTLACGARLYVIPRRDLPIVAATAVLGGGAGRVGPERGGLAQLTVDLMDEGTERHDSAALALAAERMGTGLSTSCGWDGSYVNVQCLAPHLAESLALAVDVATRPTFPAAEFARVRGQTLAGLRSERDSADSRAHRAMLAALYPAAHPYRVPIAGTEATAARLTRDDLVAHHAAHHGPGRAAWVVAGDVDPDGLAAGLDAMLSGWAGPSAAPGDVEPPPRRRSPRLILLNKPGAAQAVLRMGHVGINRADPDYLDLLVLNHILGGQFTSRLNAKLREEKGFTYGVRSQYDTRRGAGPFSVSASIQSDKVAEALADALAEVRGLRDDRPPTAAEVDDARRALIEGQARHFETPSALVARYANLFLHDLPVDEYASLPGRLGAVSPATVAAAAARHLDPDGLAAVVVADADLVEGQLGRLGWAEVERLDDAPLA